MIAAVRATLVTGFVVLMSASTVAAEPRLPGLGRFSVDLVEAARRQSAAEPPAEHGEFELPSDPVAERREEEWARSRQVSRLANDDNDATHYARGRCLIMNIFIDHANGTWSEAERDTMAARHSVAKDHYLSVAPPEANLDFDNVGSTFYWQYTVSIPDSIVDEGFTWDHTEQALDALGFTDDDGDGQIIDDFNFFFQEWNGGWDNVLASFQAADVTGRAFANSAWSRVRQYTDDSANVRAHEWGHLFGACDEYVGGSGTCAGGIDCGPCQSDYLLSVIDNGNCNLTSCPTNVPCLMDNNVFTGLCDYTLNHFAWWDDDGNGQLDRVRRRVSGETFADIWELWDGGWFQWNSVSHGMVYHQNDRAWAVAGVRSPATADYDLLLYADNNHNNLLAWSTADGNGEVDFVVGDYNHNPLSNEHLAVSRWSGDTASYRMNYESGGGMLFPDGVDRSFSWDYRSVVRVWDVPLFAGETVTFDVDVTSGNLDPGIALFRSTGQYWGMKATATWLQDANGAGAGESWTYNVPADDVYGLVVFSNSDESGTYDIQVGPTPQTLAEATPFHSAWPLRLFDYDPIFSYWSFVGNRPSDAGAATATTVELFDDSTYQTSLEKSELYDDPSPTNIDFIVVDHNHASSAPEYVRVVRETGTATHRTEWEQGSDILAGASTTALWGSGHVGRIWDVEVEAGTSYFLREYHNTASSLDTGIYVFSSEDGDRYKRRQDYVAASNSRPPADGGEWLTYTATADDWAAVSMIVNDESSDFYSVWWGPKVSMSNDLSVTRTEEVLWGSANASSGYWHVYGVRSEPGDHAAVWLYGDAAYSASDLYASDQVGVGNVSFVVADYHHTPAGTVRPRFRRSSGTGPLDCEMDGGAESFVWTGGQPVGTTYAWPARDVAEAIDVYLPAGQPVAIRATDVGGTLDLGLAVFGSGGGTYHAASGAALASVDASGPGGAEILEFVPPVGDWYGLVVWNSVDASGTWQLQVGSQGAVDAPLLAEAPRALAVDPVPNPFRGGTDVRFAMPREQGIRLDVFDVSGRLVRTLEDGVAPAGRHSRVWDGRDAAGRSVGAGVYFVRLATDRGDLRTRRVVRVR